MIMKNPTEKFQRTVIDAVTDAANQGVHPAIVHFVLCGLAADVVTSVKAANQMAKEKTTTKTAAAPTHSPSPGGEGRGEGERTNQPPDNVLQIPKADPAN